MPADKAGAAIHEATTFPNFLIVFSFESKYEAKTFYRWLFYSINTANSFRPLTH